MEEMRQKPIYYLLKSEENEFRKNLTPYRNFRVGSWHHLSSCADPFADEAKHSSYELRLWSQTELKSWLYHL